MATRRSAVRVASGASVVSHAGARPRWPVVWLLLVISLSGAGLYALTDGLTAWTLDQRRENRIAAGAMRLPAVAVWDQQGREAVWFGADASDLPDARLGASASPPAQSSPQDAIYLVDVIYTRCMTVCRALGAEFAQLQARIAADGLSGRIGLRSLSFDPRDGVADLAGYGREHRARLPDWAVATAVDPTAMRALLREADVIAIPDGFGGFEHNGGLHVVDARGRVLGTFTLEAYQDAYAFARAALPAAGAANVDGGAP